MLMSSISVPYAKYSNEPSKSMGGASFPETRQLVGMLSVIDTCEANLMLAVKYVVDVADVETIDVMAKTCKNNGRVVVEVEAPTKGRVGMVVMAL
mgnify:CR=1 FL=1